jgi:hypothetical protein
MKRKSGKKMREHLSPYEYLESIATYTYNDVDSIIQELEKHYTVYIGEVIEDLYAIPSFLQVVDPTRLSTHSEDEIETLAYLNKETDSHIFFTDNPNPIAMKHFTRNQFTVIKDFNSKRIELEALNVKQKVQNLEKKRRDHEKLFARRMLIELKVLNGEKLYIEELAKEFNVSARTIYRDFQFLNGIGEIIEYSKEKKCYEMVFSFYGELFKSDKNTNKDFY